MAEAIKFTATKLNGTGKKGVMTPDADGYYTMVIGGLNVFNSVGEYYTLDGAKALFEKSSIFMRRVTNGCLKGEVGHPKRQPGMTDNQYVNRILTIDEPNTCCHFKDIWLDPVLGRQLGGTKNPDLVAIVAKFKPSGAKGPALEKALQSPGENVCFSIRAMTKDYFSKGQCFRVLSQIFTWDWVTEPGISIANKFDSPALETIDNLWVKRSSIEAATTSFSDFGVACEDSRILAVECLKVFDGIQNKSVPPLFTKW